MMRRLATVLLGGFLAVAGCDSGGGGGNAGPADGGAGDAGGRVMVDVTGLVSILIAPQNTVLLPGSQKQFTALGSFPGGEQRDLTAAVEWVTSDPAVVSFSTETPGLATVHQDATVTLTARIAGVEGQLAFEKTCDYPMFPGGFVLGETVPPVAWTNAYIGDGTSVTQQDFSFEDLYCDAEWDHIRTVVIVFGAGWCGACSAFAQRLNADAEALARQGTLALYVEFEDENYEPADTEYAQRHLSRLIGNGPGIRVGDNSTEPSKLFFTASGIIRGGLPVVVVLRTSDMRVIYDSNGVEGPVRLMDVLTSPELDWTQGDPDAYRSNCQAGREEPGEPNDTFQQAGLLEPGSVRGGICEPEPDFYRVELEGGWDVTLNFSHVTGDLDVYVWDVAEDKPLVGPDGLPVGSASLDDNESFQWNGPAVIKVVGHDYASAEYLLTLRSL